MSFSMYAQFEKIAIHWNHILRPSDPKTGKEIDVSLLGTVKKVAGIILFALSTGLIGFKPSVGLFLLGGSYHFYQAYQKATQQMEEKPSKTSCEMGIQAIKKANEEGKKIGLVIGREKKQALPKENGWLWVSGNIFGETEIAKDRVHLNMDFNDPEACKKVEKLFDKVVIDFSTIKFINTPWERLKALLKPLSTSQMITETFGSLSLARKEKVNVAEGAITYPLKFACNLKQEKTAIAAGEEKIRNHLQTLFESVELQRNVTFPTRENIDTREGNIFILTGPTK